jgi:hypothetical protein
MGGHGPPKVSPGLAMPKPLCPASGPPLKRPYIRFRGCPPTGQLAYGCLQPLWTPHAVRLCKKDERFLSVLVSRHSDAHFSYDSRAMTLTITSFETR